MQDIKDDQSEEVYTASEETTCMKVRRLTKIAIIPRRNTDRAARYDLHADHDQVLEGRAVTMVGTGIALEIPAGRHAQIRPRSGLMKAAGVTAFQGTIDSDYRGEIMVLMTNSRVTPFTLHQGDRFAQFVIMQNDTEELVEVK